MDVKESVIILSDIHIGTNAPTVWYRKEIHEKYLIAIFNDIISRAEKIQELILLGDIFEFWAYPPDENPPSMEDIIACHPNILGPQGKLIQVLSALKGRVLYIPGNHDMNITEEDIKKIQGTDGYSIKYQSGAYIPDYDTGVLFTHGNEFTLFNSPCSTVLTPLPIGYFVSKSFAYKVDKELKKKPGLTVADLNEHGIPNLADFIFKIPGILKTIMSNNNIVSKFIDTIAYVTGIPKNLPIRVNADIAVTLNDVKIIYKDLLSLFSSSIKRQGLNDYIIILNALAADFNGNYLSWFAQKYAIESTCDVVIMGHTHTAISGLNNAMIDYANTGYMCPSIPDLPTTPITYGEYSLSTRKVMIKKVECESPCLLKTYSGPVINISSYASNNYSCYVLIGNNSSVPLRLSALPKAHNGKYVILPPDIINPGQASRFWIQDIESITGASGSVSYVLPRYTQIFHNPGNNVPIFTKNENLMFSFSCFKNQTNAVSPTPFYATLIRDSKSSPPNTIPKSGNPLFVFYPVERILTSTIFNYPMYNLSNYETISTEISDEIVNAVNPDSKFTIGWSVYNSSFEYFATIQNGVLSKAEELGIQVLSHDQKSDTVEMITGCNELLEKGVDALIISPINPEAVPIVVANAKKKNVPVVIIDIGTGGADVFAFIISDSFGGGILAGEYALRLIREKSIQSKNVAIIKVESTSTYALRRGQAFKNVMIDSGFNVIAEVTGNSSETEAYHIMENILTTYEDNLAVVFCENDRMALGASQAIVEAGKIGQILVIGFDGISAAIEAIKEGRMQGTIAQQPFKMGTIGVEITNSILTGNLISYDDWTKKEVFMDVYLIDETGEARTQIS
jgi:ribose transport system substrate-binding protein